MAELNPIHAWRRLLALPNESRAKTLAIAALTALCCTALVSGATVLLRPVQTANRAAETQLRLQSLLEAIPGMQALLAADPQAQLSTVVVRLDTGRADPDIGPQDLEGALQDSANWTPLPPEADLAGIGSRPNLAQVYLLRDADGVRLLVLPIAGAGYNGTIEAMIALEGDMTRIAGLTVTRQSETPGLGARIEEAAWQAGFAGKSYLDSRGQMAFEVTRGPAGGTTQVDGITGATRTSNAMTRMVRFWLGPQGYGPLIAAVQRGDF